MTTPLERYHLDLQKNVLIEDAAQKQVVQHTQQLYDELIEAVKKHHSWLAVLSDKLMRTQKRPIRGIYLWGGIGRGKTYLVDNFYHSLPFQQKMRLHFHRFMRQIHQELKTLKHTQSPLKIVAKRLAKQVKIICLDELFVSDITDAMLLKNLLKALFEQQVTLVVTSNIAPDNLYKDGLQRELFLPAIALIKQHTNIINLDSGIDYRLRTLEQTKIYHYPLDETANQKLFESFKQIAHNEGQTNVKLQINGRIIPSVRCTDGVVWFDFQALCDIPRSVVDYIELARQFNSVIISNIMAINKEDETDNILRLVNLVDEFYDRNVKLMISAEVPPEQLYYGQRHALKFQRTLSRLKEMSSHTYLKRPHLP